jgi:hypothetical protein
MLLLGFYFLLYPRECASTTNEDASPFCFCDVHFLIHTRRLSHYTCPKADLQHVLYIVLELISQKNGVRGELVGLGCSGHPRWCPVDSIANCIWHLCQHPTPPHMPLYKYYDREWRNIDITTLARHLRMAVDNMGHTYSIALDDILVQSLGSSRAMSLHDLPHRSVAFWWNVMVFTILSLSHSPGNANAMPWAVHNDAKSSSFWGVILVAAGSMQRSPLPRKVGHLNGSNPSTQA